MPDTPRTLTNINFPPLLPQDVKGRVLEQYIVSNLASPGNTLLIKGQRILGSGAPSDKIISTLIETSRRLQIVRWYGNSVPLLLSNLSANSPTLFWPHSPNYPGVDALIWMPDNKTLLLVQITLSSVQEHASNLWVEQQELEAKWRAILGGGTETKAKGLWITPRPAGRPQNKGQHVCTLQMLLADNASRFHLLEHLVGANGESVAVPPKNERPQRMPRLSDTSSTPSAATSSTRMCLHNVPRPTGGVVSDAGSRGAAGGGFMAQPPRNRRRGSAGLMRLRPAVRVVAFSGGTVMI
jgi:hypothetical protein